MTAVVGTPFRNAKRFQLHFQVVLCRKRGCDCEGITEIFVFRKRSGVNNLKLGTRVPSVKYSRGGDVFTPLSFFALPSALPLLLYCYAIVSYLILGRVHWRRTLVIVVLILVGFVILVLVFLLIFRPAAKQMGSNVYANAGYSAKVNPTAACNLLFETYCLPPAACHLLPATCCVQRTLCNLLSATCCLQPTVCNLLPSNLLSETYCLHLTACNLLPTTYCLRPTAWILRPAVFYPPTQFRVAPVRRCLSTPRRVFGLGLGLGLGFYVIYPQPCLLVGVRGVGFGGDHFPT